MKQSERIDSLTGLRFFAAFLIFLWHLRGYFLPNDAFGRFFPAGAVPLFFVLSGFVLSVSGMRGRSWTDFFVARVARIWPAHMAALVLLFAVFWPWSKVYFDDAQSLANLALNVTLIQDWFPINAIYGGYNGVSWSISAEMFFYAIFPLLFFIANRRPLRLLVVGPVLVVSFILCVSAAIPSIDHAWLGAMNPISGAWAFIFGVLCGTWFMRDTARGKRIGAAGWTAIELAAIALALLGNGRYLTPDLSGLPLPVQMFAKDLGPAPVYAMLITVLALSKGWIARALSGKVLVYLGEVSFSFYLVHQIIIRWYADKTALFDGASWGARLGFVTLASLLVSMLIFHCVETPCRKAIVNAWKNRKSTHAARADKAVAR